MNQADGVAGGPASGRPANANANANAAFELHAGALRLAVRPDLGGCVAGLWHRNTPILRSTAPAALDSVRLAAMFPLLPYSNRLGYRHFRWHAHDYTTQPNYPDSPHSLHGIGWQRPWQIVASSAYELVLGLEHAGDADWPFAFSARQYFALSADAFSVRLQLTNRAGVEQPVGLGWHPYFVKRPRSRLHVEVSSRWDSDATLLPVRKVEQPGIDSDVSHLDYDNCFAGWSGPVRIRDECFSLRLASPLPYLVVFTPPKRDFFCVEPVSHVSNALNMAEPARHGVVALPPGETMEATMTLEVAVV